MKKVRTAACCRVSTQYEEQESSLEIQIAYFTERINSDPQMKLVDVYAEKASALNMGNRPEFNRMIRDCRKGKIDLILTKSISRFGRNTLETLKTARELYELGVKVEFEKEKINNYDKEVRTAMEIYAAFAQQESQSMSENIKMGIRRKMRQGGICLNCTRFLGYTKDPDGRLVIVEDEAKVVRKIFELYLNGFGVRKIKKHLEENGIKTVTGKNEWSTSTIDRILSNEKYVGDVLMQKSFTENFLTGKRKKNNGELDMYFIENDHEPIISREVFEQVQIKKGKK